MKILYPVVATLFLTISGCATTQPPPRADGFELITTKEQYLALVADRTAEMESTGFTTTARADGTLEGGTEDRKLSGSWTWEDGFFCREGTLGDQALKPECQEIAVLGDQLKMTRKKGKGGSLLMKLK